MTKPAACPLCKKKFGIFRWRCECSECENIICSNCSEDKIFLNRRVCNPCLATINKGVSSIKAVRSGHVGGHKITRSLEIVSGDRWEKNQQDTVNYVKYLALKLGANALVSLDIEKKTDSEPGSGDGTHYFSVFLASGRPVEIAKKDVHKNANRMNIASEIEKLVKLRDKGHITEDEFVKAKKRIIT